MIFYYVTFQQQGVVMIVKRPFDLLTVTLKDIEANKSQLISIVAFAHPNNINAFL